MPQCPNCGSTDHFYDPETLEYCCKACDSSWTSEPEYELFISDELAIEKQIIELFNALSNDAKKDALEQLKKYL